MPYRIKETQTLAEEIQRIAEEQIDRAIGEIDDASLSRHKTVHQVRKRCKKLRGLLRLLRGPLDEEDLFDRENARYRDAARELSHVRDAEALIETYDRLMEHFGDQVDRSAFGTIRRRLTLRRQEIADHETELDATLGEFRETLVAGRSSVPEWARQAEDFDSLLPGLAKTYRRGRRAMTVAYDDPSPEAFHEWRKRTKYHRYHCRLLRQLWPPVMKAWQAQVSELADFLGDAHDLSVFHKTLGREARDFGDGKTLEALFALIERRRVTLREEASPLGKRVFAEKPKHLTRRIRCWGEAWEGARSDGK